jgi:5-dehydro-2-deoxygluconokinase
MQRLYNLHYPEWWNCRRPPRANGRHRRTDRRAIRIAGVVLLGLNAPIEQLLQAASRRARSRSCCGFAVGRTIFHEPARAGVAGRAGGAAGGNDAIDAALIAVVRRNYETLIDAWLAARRGQARHREEAG